MNLLREQWLSRGLPKPNTVFLQLVFVYVCLLSYAFAMESGTFKLLSSVFAFWVVAVMLVNAVFMSPARFGARRVSLGRGLHLGFSIYYIGMALNLLVEHGHTDIQEWLKIALAPLFLLFGFVFSARDRTPLWQFTLNRVIFWLLLILPIALWLAQLGMGRTSLGGNQVVGFFVNRNNAAVYLLALVALYTALTGRRVSNVIVYVLVGVSFGALGVMLATALALFYAVGKLRYLGHLLLLLVLGVLLIFLLPERLVFDRIKPVFDSYMLLVSGRINLHTVTYAQLVTELHTKDLSFIFRLRHWTNLMDIFVDGARYQQLFGFGVGEAVRLSDMHLVPHNDYVRYLFECGPITLIGFVTLLFSSLRVIGRRWEAVPLVAICIYFGSENLINNYLAMIMFFFSLGATSYQIGASKSVEESNGGPESRVLLAPATQ